MAVPIGGTSLTWAHCLDAHDVDTLTATLWTRHGCGDVIAKGEYSKNGKWHRFTDAELKRIREVLGR